MKRRFYIVFMLAALLVLTACHSPRREAKRMVARAEALADTLPDSTARLIDSVLRMPVYFSERQRMDMALLQGEALFRDAPLDDDSFEDTAYRIATSPELEHAADHYAKKKQYAKAAHAALYSGYVQQHYNEKEAAMHSFKDAEQYGLLSNDSLTVARAEYRMGKMLYYEGRKQEALNALNLASDYVGRQSNSLALIENSIATVYVLLGQTDSAELFFQRSLAYLGDDNRSKLKHKVLINYAVLYRLQGKYKQSINCLKQMTEADLTDQEKAMLYLNLGKAYNALGMMDSVASNYQCLESILDITNVKEETKVSAYEALFRFAEFQGRDSLALNYYEKHKYALYDVMNQHQEQSLFRIQKQYDYETMQNILNRKIILRHRIILVISILLFVSTIIILLLQYRHKQMLKEEEEKKQHLETQIETERKTHKVQQAALSGRLRRSNEELRDVSNRLEQMLAKDALSESELSDDYSAFVNAPVCLYIVELTHKQQFKSKMDYLVYKSYALNRDQLLALRNAAKQNLPRFISNIHKQYPGLTDSDMDYCCLILLGLNEADISALLQKAYTTVCDRCRKISRIIGTTDSLYHTLHSMLFV